MKKHLCIAALAIVSASQTLAAYYVSGEIEGNVCRGFVIEACGLHKIHAVRGSDGRLFEVTNRFESVSEYKESSGRCWVSTKSTSLGVLS